ncbi:MAG: hypothetical protein ABGY71_08765 [bacterium]
MKDALQRARRNFGEGALVISHERTSDGGVTVAVAQRPAQAGMQASTTSSGAEPAKQEVDITAYDEVRQRLAQTGFDAEWIESNLRRAAHAARHGEHPMDRFGVFIGSEFRIAHLPNTPGVTRLVAFIGNTGVGKTTGLVKLGARFVQAKRKVGMATLDSQRVGAVDQYRGYAEMLGAPMRALHADETLTTQTLGAHGKDVVLLDTKGCAESDAPQLKALHRTLYDQTAGAELDTFLVFSASASRSALREVTEAFSDLRLAGCVITKIDETRQPAAVLEHILELGLPVAFVSDGQDLGLNFRRATPELLADLVLLGRVE